MADGSGGTGGWLGRIHFGGGTGPRLTNCRTSSGADRAYMTLGRLPTHRALSGLSLTHFKQSSAGLNLHYGYVGGRKAMGREIALSPLRLRRRRTSTLTQRAGKSEWREKGLIQTGWKKQLISNKSQVKIPGGDFNSLPQYTLSG